MRLLPPISPAHSAVPILTTPAPAQTKATTSKDAVSRKRIDTSEPAKAQPYPTVNQAPLSKTQSAALSIELNTLYNSVMDDLNADDARYIERVYKLVAGSEIAARGLLAVAARLPKKRYKIGTWLLGTSMLSFSKIVNNMELGHNVMHGQYDWMQHPHLNSQKFDWDIVCPAPLWQHSHNYLHHTFTNIVGRDHDVGYHLIRVTDEQPWTPEDRSNLFKTMVLALGFEWAVAFHDIQISVDEYADSADKHRVLQQKARALGAKIARQVGKDYIILPATAGALLGRGSAISTLTGNYTANIARNLWTWAIIFCGHFTDQAHIYSHLDENETKGDWYVRQILGSSNIKGHKLFHFLTGNLSHQIEHHIFPDMPAHRYASIAPEVEAICQKYDLSYNTGNFGRQFTQVLKRIYHFSKPNTDELKAYEQGLKDDDAIKTIEKQQRISEPVTGIKRHIPQVVRQSLYYAFTRANNA
ncbi:MAG: acyl-CoA desaturase [Psychrobacter sp.]|nr:acyl-CoA desaturase [Psychrobacter sp.]